MRAVLGFLNLLRYIYEIRSYFLGYLVEKIEVPKPSICCIWSSTARSFCVRINRIRTPLPSVRIAPSPSVNPVNQATPLLWIGDFPAAISILLKVLKLKDSVEEFWGKYPPNFCTYCSNNRLGWLWNDHVFDYVLFSQELNLKVTDVQVDLQGTPSNPLSDHYGLRVDFDFSRAVPSRNLEADREITIRSLDQVMRSIVREYTKASRIYNELGLWRQQLVNRDGTFWNYFSQP